MTEFPLIALLIFLALLIGWGIGRFSRKRQAVVSNSPLSLHNDYFRGLNYVINEQPDKAIEIFIKMLEVDSETVETHLALGNLFRRRGEVDRAIRIHQNLIARPTLSNEQRSQAMLELGKDYMSSGLFDRAESLLLELTEKGIHLKEAYKHLIQIYQQEKDWDRAITMARQLEYSNSSKLGSVIAHYYCEQALVSQQNGQLNEFHDRINRALGTDPNSVRASLMQAEQRLREGKHKQALKALQRIEKQAPEFLPETVDLFTEIYQQMEKPQEYLREMQHLTDDYGVIAAMIKLADYYILQEDNDEALKKILDKLSRSPSLSGIDKMLSISLSDHQHGHDESLKNIKLTTENLLEQQPGYQCNQCGFEAKQLHWQCPSCKEWNTIKPLYGLMGH